MNYKVLQVTQLYRPSPADKKTKQYYPLFLVTLKNEPGAERIFKLNSLFQIKISIEVYRRKTVIQCYRCQSFNHTQHRCQANPRCVSCGEEHYSHLCTNKSKKIVCCANCQEKHPSNYKGCKLFIQETLKRKKLLQQKPIPTPTVETSSLSIDKKTYEEQWPQIGTANGKTKRNVWQQKTSEDNEISSEIPIEDLKQLYELFKEFNLPEILQKIKQQLPALRAIQEPKEKLISFLVTILA
jgi:hypothetical protein